MRFSLPSREFIADSIEIMARAHAFDALVFIPNCDKCVPGMKEFWNTLQLIFTAVGGWIGYFLGGCDGLLIALLIFVVCDYVTGVM